VPLFLPDFNLKNYNTLGVSASARFYVSVTNEQELREALQFAAQENLPLLILGGGSNIVLSDNFPGLALHMRIQGKTLVSENDEYVWLQVAAGENWHSLVEYSLKYHYWGLENLSLIPGSVGAAPIQNIGAYGVELKDVFEELSAVDIRSGLSVTFIKDSCAFGYRDSVFKNQLKDQYIITSVTFKLNKIPQPNLTYPVLAERFAHRSINEINPQEISQMVCDIRQQKLPDPAQIPNVGSFFKNPVVARNEGARLQQLFPDLAVYPVDESHVKLAAGWLIERAGWRGYSENGTGVHAQQALVLTNPGGADGKAILALAQKIQDSVAKKYGIDLEPEPRIYP